MTALQAAPEVDPSFVGRMRELTRFRAALAAAMEGRRQILLLCGEPGIGKTRCAEVFAQIAEDCGALALWGRCHEEPGAPSYWPWVQMLREYVRACSESELQLMAGERVQDMAAILPDLAAHADERATERAMNDGVRFRTFDAIAQFLCNAAQRVPLVLIIDNLHWADAPSLSLLEFLNHELARSRVLIICTYRDVAASRRNSLACTLGELRRSTGVERIRLAGLPEASIAELADRALGITLPKQAIDAIYSQTDGNPLFVIELLKVLREESAAVDADIIPVGIPDGVRETIGRRLSHLPAPCNELLAMASVLGRHFTTRELVSISEHGFEFVLGNLEHAVRAGLIEPSSARGEGYRFTHALIREVLYEELPVLQRLKLHGRVADTLAEIHRADLSSVLTTIAHHYSEALPLGYAEQAATFELRAAEQATQMCAYEDAVTHYDRALAALSVAGYENDARIVQAWFLKGCAQTLIGGDIKLVTEAFLQGVKHAIRLRSPLLLDLITRLLWSTSDGPQSYLVPLLEKTLATLPPDDSIARAKALVSLAFALRCESDASRLEALVTEAVDMARRLGDAGTLCTCVKLAVIALRLHPQTLRRRLELGEQYIEAARRSGDDEGRADAYSWQVLHLIEDARPDEAERLLEDYRRMSVARFGIHQYYVRCADVTFALMRGEWQNAEQEIEALLAVGSKMRRGDAEGVYSAQMFALNRDRGRLRELQPSVEQFVRSGTTNVWLPGIMLTCAELGMYEDAKRYFERLAQDNFASIRRDDMFVTCLVFCAETCCRLGDVERAKVLYGLMAPYAGGTANHPRAVCFGSMDLYLGMLAALSGENDRAAAHFAVAHETNHAMGAWPWVARTLFRFGAFLLKLDSAEQQARGRSMLADAEQLAARLGMTALMEEIGAGPRGVESTQYPDGFTAREVEVLQLLAIGRSNKDISAVLSISLNTVATHVRSILTKTGSANRTEAAAYAIRHGLRESLQTPKNSNIGGFHAAVPD